MRPPFRLADLLSNQYFLALWAGLAVVGVALFVNPPLTQATPASSLSIARQDYFKLFLLFLFVFFLVSFVPAIARWSKKKETQSEPSALSGPTASVAPTASAPSVTVPPPVRAPSTLSSSPFTLSLPSP